MLKGNESEVIWFKVWLEINNNITGYQYYFDKIKFMCLPSYSYGILLY